MANRLEIAEALSARTVNELNEKEKMIQEQANLIKEKEKAAEIFEEKNGLMQIWQKG